MAMALAGKGGGGGRRRGRSGRNRPMAEINVTPLVDVMLVLLIVFMVAAPLLTVGVPIDLPQTKAKELNTQSKPISITVTPAGEIYLQDQQVQLESLIEQLAAAAPNGTEERVYVRGDQASSYGEVMKVMGVLSAAGYTKIGLITAQDQVR
jgi:biopolymer transport protein TolR